jgi:ADP-ribose pyrophosphatase YjhB (NUDIX family)
MSYDLLPPVDGWQEFRVGQGILVRDGDVLLCANRWYSDRPPVWTLPGGRAERGEGVSEALVREFSEETGLTVSIDRLAYVAEARSTAARRLFLTCAFAVMVVGGDLSPDGDSAIVELRFVPIVDLQTYLPSPSLASPLLNYLNNPQAAPRYWFFPDYSSA